MDLGEFKNKARNIKNDETSGFNNVKNNNAVRSLIKMVAMFLAMVLALFAVRLFGKGSDPTKTASSIANKLQENQQIQAFANQMAQEEASQQANQAENTSTAELQNENRLNAMITAVNSDGSLVMNAPGGSKVVKLADVSFPTLNENYMQIVVSYLKNELLNKTATFVSEDSSFDTAYVLVNDENITLKLASMGYVSVNTLGNNSYSSELVKAQDTAQRNNYGFWNSPDVFG